MSTVEPKKSISVATKESAMRILDNESVMIYLDKLKMLKYIYL